MTCVAAERTSPSPNVFHPLERGRGGPTVAATGSGSATTDGGATWTSEFKDPKLSPDSLSLDERRCWSADPRSACAA